MLSDLVVPLRVSGSTTKGASSGKETPGKLPFHKSLFGQTAFFVWDQHVELFTSRTQNES